jgi:large subunit ribosomal protein L49
VSSAAEAAPAAEKPKKTKAAAASDGAAKKDKKDKKDKKSGKKAKKGAEEAVKMKRAQRLNIVKHRPEAVSPPSISRMLPPLVKYRAPFTDPTWATALNQAGLQYPVRVLEETAVTPSGWTPPLGPAPDLPFAVVRTSNNNLPVYLQIKNGRTRRLTVVRHIRGDVTAFVNDLQALLKHAASVAQRPPPEIKLGPGGVVKINGSYLEPVNHWLRGLGF